MPQTTPPSITAVPTPVPQRNDRTTFSTRVDAFVTWLTTAVTEFGAVATNVYNNAVDAYNNSVLANQWANLTTGIVAATDYSSKAYAIGGTGVTTTIGAAKEWAVTTGAAVITGAYSAKEWAIGTFIRGMASGGSAKDWATYTSGTVDDTGYSAKQWATKATTTVDGASYSAYQYAQNAAASALTSTNAPGTNATSTTSATIGAGSKSLTIQTGKALVPGMWIIAADTTAPATNWMAGTITSYDTGTGALVFTSIVYVGSGTLTAWTVSLSGPGGATLGGNTFTGAQILSDQQVSRAMLVDFGYTFLDKGNSSTTTQTFNYTAGSHQKVTATGNHTIATSNWPPTGNLGEILIEYVNGGAYALTWPTINWLLSNGSTTTSFATYMADNPGRSTLQSSGTDFIVLWSRDAGTTIYGKLI